MSGDGTTEGTRVELYARSSLPEIAEKRRDQIATRLDELANAGHISQVEIHNWRKKVSLTADCREQTRYEAFTEWADEVGVDLAPFFDTRTCYSMDSGEKGERLVLPALCLAVYRDGTLQSVYPHSTNDGSRSVMDCLRAIESARRRTPDPDGATLTADDDSLEVSH
ncbi:HTH domain-containing protein [Halorientalis brevis]|uniref:HTH domain-containing protein n=1 Tax=Halorientalis brevis TaxID=1126241 RepID=A0ABD6CH88_9EURY|nr:HTH domain-containing protein [Halorientalis brevis]